MQGLTHTTGRMGVGSHGLCRQYASTLSCRGPSRSVAALASINQQQQQQQQQQGSFSDLTKQYQGLVAPAPQQKTQSSGKKSSSSSSSSSRSSSKQQGPRLQPTQQAAVGPTAQKRKAVAAARSATPSRSKGAAAGADAPVQATGRRTQKPGAAATSSRRQAGFSDDSSNTRGSSSSTTSRSSSRRALDSELQSRSSQPAVIPSAWKLPSNGKGFGIPAAPATTTSSSSSSTASSSSSVKGSGKLVRVFRFGVDAAAVTKAVEACGWQGRVGLVETIKEADLILACKCSSSGKHRNLAQGQKAASNAGIPFVVVGRKMSAHNFKQAMVVHVEPHSKEAAAVRAAAAEAAAKEAANKAVADRFFSSAAKWGRPNAGVAA